MLVYSNSKTFAQSVRHLLKMYVVPIAVLSIFGASHVDAASSPTKAAAPAVAGQRNPPNAGISDYADIASTLQQYIDAARTGDGSSQRSIWFDHAHIVGSEDGKFENVDADAFAKELNEGGPASTIAARIVDVTISGPAASARIEIQGWGGFRYTDFFLLYKREGVWKVSAKVFDSHDRN